jgi:hypothetical protein
VLVRDELGSEERGLGRVAGKARGAELVGLDVALSLCVFQAWVRSSRRVLELDQGDWRVEDPGPASTWAWARAREVGRATMDAREPMAGRIRGHCGVGSSVISCISEAWDAASNRKGGANEVRVKARRALDERGARLRFSLLPVSVTVGAHARNPSTAPAPRHLARAWRLSVSPASPEPRERAARSRICYPHCARPKQSRAFESAASSPPTRAAPACEMVFKTI